MKELNDRYILAISGGPDSMALLDMLRVNKVMIVCAHVNYHKRDSAKRDQKIIEDYCNKYHIDLYIKDYVDDKRGNFQKLARDFRYDFFKELGKKLDINKVLVAHHKDDVIETYLMQIKRGSTPAFYGIKPTTKIKDMTIIRPLLAFSKEDIMIYLDEHKIEYGIDESNLSDQYTRNSIRINIVNKLNKLEKEKYIVEINELNKAKLLKESELNALVIDDRLSVETLELSNDKVNLLRSILDYQPSTSHIESMLKELGANKRVIIPFHDKLLIKEYGWISLCNKPEKYRIELNDFKQYNHRCFRVVDKADSFCCATITQDDFPLTIRNYSEGDKIQLPYGTKSLSRWFIDKKIGYIDRNEWPVVLNKNNKVILVPKIGCSLEYYSNNPNLYVIK